jgi:spermidine synthase
MPARKGPARTPWAILPIVVASGFAGLGYEMVWTRQLSVALGTDMMAILGSIAGFFSGLAIGAFALDGALRRTSRPRLAYALLECVIGIWGALSVWLLPAAGRMLPPLLGTEPAPAVLWAASFAFPALALLPATVAMGGTLTALERIVSRTRGESRCSAAVYAANTAGAVAGTLCSAFVLFPALGLSGTLLVLAAINGMCAVGTLTLVADAGRLPSGSAEDGTEPPKVADAAAVGATDRGGLRLGLTLLATGLLGISVEVLVVRLAAQALQDTIYSFAGLLSAYLLGTALGGALWQRGNQDAKSARLGMLLALTAAACLATAALAPSIARIAEQSASLGVTGELGVALALFLLPSAAMGALFGCLLQEVRDRRGSIGWAVGINSIGAALAPLIAAQVLIPLYGAWLALVLTATAYLALLPMQRTALAWSALPVALTAFLLLGPAPSLVRVPPGGSLLAMREGAMVTASAVDDPSGARYLEINGHFRMGGTSSMRSDYRQAVLPLLLHPGPQRALFLGVGTGATLVGGSRMPGVAVQGVELSREVVDLLPWFADPNGGNVMPPITVADARRFVAAERSQYDVIIADLFHPALEGSGALYTTEHFAAVRRRLAPGGLFCQWLPLYQLDAPSLRAIVRSFQENFPTGSAWLNHYSVRTPMLALIGYQADAHLDVAALTRRLESPAVAAVARPLGFASALDVLGQFVGGTNALRRLAGDGERNTDDRPFVALDARRNVQALTAPPADLLIAVTRSVQPDAAELLTGDGPADLAPQLAAYWRARNRFLEAGAALQGDPRGAALVAAAAPGLLDAIRLSASFDPAYQPLLGMARALLTSDHDAGVQLLHAMVTAAPSRTEAQALLARETQAAQGVN